MGRSELIDLHALLCASQLNSCCLEIECHHPEGSLLSVDQLPGHDLESAGDLFGCVLSSACSVAGLRSSPWPRDQGFRCDSWAPSLHLMPGAVDPLHLFH